MQSNFAIIGVGGFVAPRHLKAVADTGSRLLAACDPNDSVGILDSYFRDARFFTEVERFDRFLEKQRRKSEAERVHYLSICSPNYLHDAHVRLALRVGAHAICEKPLVINPWNLDQLATMEREAGVRVYTVLQLRLLPPLLELKKRIDASSGRAQVELTYVTRRGPWYHTSWKGQPEKSGGLPMNIGIHFFDILHWIFGAVSAGTPRAPARSCEVHLREPDRWSGFLELERADVKWYLSVRQQDLPEAVVAQGRPAFRSITIDGQELEFSDGFGDLHTRVYRQILDGQGYGIEDARPSIELAYRIRTAELQKPGERAHAWLSRALPPT
jgi:UDP-N-acetyl-2-amino-2-deoxyglucuronate dehydrogenase